MSRDRSSVAVLHELERARIKIDGRSAGVSLVELLRGMPKGSLESELSAGRHTIGSLDSMVKGSCAASGSRPCRTPSASLPCSPAAR